MPNHAYAIAPPPVVSLAIAGSKDRFPVGRIFCVGRNYAEHAREMGHDPEKAPPFFFMKPPTALLTDNADMAYPAVTNELHHEVELVVALGRGARNVAPENALDLVFGYAVGLDMTRRDLQAEAKKLGRPWETAKAFDQSAPCSAIQPGERIGHPATGVIELKVNGKLRQRGDLAEMIWNVPDTIAYLSTLFELQPGDLIYTGTPAGVAEVRAGDHLEAAVDRVGELSVRIR